MNELPDNIDLVSIEKIALEEATIRKADFDKAFRLADDNDRDPEQYRESEIKASREFYEMFKYNQQNYSGPLALKMSLARVMFDRKSYLLGWKLGTENRDPGLTPTIKKEEIILDQKRGKGWEVDTNFLPEDDPRSTKGNLLSRSLIKGFADALYNCHVRRHLRPFDKVILERLFKKEKIIIINDLLEHLGICKNREVVTNDRQRGNAGILIGAILAIPNDYYIEEKSLSKEKTIESFNKFLGLGVSSKYNQDNPLIKDSRKKAETFLKTYNSA